jgi:hypothetical protein
MYRCDLTLTISEFGNGVLANSIGFQRFYITFYYTKIKFQNVFMRINVEQHGTFIINLCDLNFYLKKWYLLLDP